VNIFYDFAYLIETLAMICCDEFGEMTLSKAQGGLAL
jgi:hypothetical protein